jgi:hypothetical protein
LIGRSPFGEGDVGLAFHRFQPVFEARQASVVIASHPVQLGLVLLPHLLEFALYLRNLLRSGRERKRGGDDQAGADCACPLPTSRT